jgi:hypothetical protein
VILQWQLHQQQQQTNLFTRLYRAEGFEERVYNCAPGKDSCSDFLDKLKLHFKAATGGTDQATALKNHQQVTALWQLLAAALPIISSAGRTVQTGGLTCVPVAAVCAFSTYCRRPRRRTSTSPTTC